MFPLYSLPFATTDGTLSRFRNPGKWFASTREVVTTAAKSRDQRYCAGRAKMAKGKKPTTGITNGRALFGSSAPGKRRRLILPRYLAEEGEKAYLRGAAQDRAHEIMVRWADMESDGRLARKETSLDADFLAQVFGDALGYRTGTDSADEYERERNFSIPTIGTADGALGNFRHGTELSPLVVIELKDADTDLDRDKFNGRTPVQQCWDYLDHLPQCPWGIVSNFVTIRLYHREKTPAAYEEFTLQELRELRRFRQFYCLFERGALVRPIPGYPLRAATLLELTENRQREVGDELYEAYSENRYHLIEHLRFQRGKSLDAAIHIAQKVLDRIIFIAFCEDRGLMPPQLIDRVYNQLPPFAKVTNPRWRNFLDLFQAVDRGHANLIGSEQGYNGGLFRHDPEVDDLQLNDDWTEFFKSISAYDFRDEVNVEVLGHLFEKSVSEIERIRVGGLFAPEGRPTAGAGTPTMPKSAERKRFGIYYTPPDFTRFIVRNTVGIVAESRLKAVRDRFGIDENNIGASERSAKLAEFWMACLAALRTIKVCDPACGSGAFLIEAYDALEESYLKVVDGVILQTGNVNGRLDEKIPAFILADNLFGVDLSPQAVEITQLALWIRSAQHGKTLADLSHNIVCGNSLVSDAQIDPRALDWQAEFPNVFGRDDRPGFDCVIGNPPWERLKLQEREFFAFSAPRIAGAVSAARRRELIDELPRENPELFDRYTAAQRLAERTLEFARRSGQYPLTGVGDINTYMLFAELASKIVAADGRAGLLVPSGIATDKTTKEFFASLVDGQSLIGLYDFENRKRVFPDVDSRFKFSVLLFGGREIAVPRANFVFFAHRMADLDDKERQISLNNRDFALLNPNTRTCPIFRSRRDAELTKAIYRRIPILVDNTRDEGGNPWGVKFVRMFDQTNDAELFHDREQLQKLGFRRDGNRWRKGKQVFLPLYEAKMVQAYDHRAAGVLVAQGNWVRQGQTEPTTIVSHQNPEFTVEPRWWVEESAVRVILGEREQPAYLCYKDVTSPTNERTMIAAMVPRVGTLNSAPIVITDQDVSLRRECCLLANLNSYVLDFVARQKVGGVHLNFFIVEQLPILAPAQFMARLPWTRRQTLERWVSDRVLKLTCTANDMRPLAEAAEFEPPVHRWDPRERAELMAELDAAFFLLYSLDRQDVEYVLSTFTGPKREGPVAGGTIRMDRLVLDAYDRLAAAS
jgi:hypothetical protein